jgi:hypothetical protein
MSQAEASSSSAAPLSEAPESMTPTAETIWSNVIRRPVRAAQDSRRTLRQVHAEPTRENRFSMLIEETEKSEIEKEEVGKDSSSGPSRV